MSFYPLSGMPRQKQLWGWISFDVANQSFTLIINTLLFSIFFGKVIVRDDTIDDQIWALTFGSSMLLTALASPIAGSLVDKFGWRKRFLVGSGLCCGLLTCLLGLIKPGQIALAVAIYVPANFFYSIGENFLASFLPVVAPPKSMGRVSGFSWGCAYAAAILLLGLTAGMMQKMGYRAPETWRPFFVFAGVWFLCFTVPTIVWLPEPPAEDPEDSHEGNVVVVGFKALLETIEHTRKHRDLSVLLLASLLYGTAMSVVVFFAGKIAEEYGFTEINLVLFVAVITLSGVVGTLLPMLYQDSLGHRKSTLLLLGVWLFTTVGFAGYSAYYEHLDGHVATWPLWVIGNLLGFGLGSLGSANRAFVGYLAPLGHEGSVFGLWGMTFKLSAIMTFPFAFVRDRAGTPASLLLLAFLVAVGIGLTLMVNEKRGRALVEAESHPVFS